jgi:hypothetical protein
LTKTERILSQKLDRLERLILAQQAEVLTFKQAMAFLKIGERQLQELVADRTIAYSQKVDHGCIICRTGFRLARKSNNRPHNTHMK